MITSAPLAQALAALDRELAALPAGELPAAFGELRRLEAANWPRLLAEARGRERPGSQADRLLTCEEAAGVLGATKDWVYRNSGRLPFTVRPGPGLLRFSAAGLQRWMRLQVGAQAS